MNTVACIFRIILDDTSSYTDQTEGSLCVFLSVLIIMFPKTVMMRYGYLILEVNSKGSYWRA